jgi:hypothetical protein
MPNFSGIWTVTQQMQAKGQSIWPAVPGAPTIGTATATGTTTATVAFTAPANLGYPATVTYTATSSPGGITGTGASSPISMTGLSSNTAYTFTVNATNSTGTGPASAASNSITTALAIGDAYGGGFYAGQISTTGNSIADYNLVIGPKSTAQSSSLTWKNTSTATPGADSNINGPQNTADMVADGNSTAYPAAWFCDTLITGGYSDWYMPAKNELEVCYYNLKPTTDSNNTSYGINPNAVPARTSNYTNGNPAQTSATVFQLGNSEAFTGSGNYYYWSSTEQSATFAWGPRFNNGYQAYHFKDGGPIVVRATRRVAV